MQANIPKKVFYTTLEIAFVFENIYSYEVTNLEYYFNIESLSNNVIKPLLIRIETSQGEVYKYTLEQIIHDLGYIPTYRLQCVLKGADLYFKVKYNNNISRIDNSKISVLQKYNSDAFDYEIKYGLRATDLTMLSEIKKLLDTENINYTYEKTDDVLHGININDDLMITFTGLKSRPNCIKPCIGKFEKYKCVGRFIVKNGIYIKGPIDEHLALIVSCPVCQQKHIVDYWDLNGKTCECGALVNANHS